MNKYIAKVNNRIIKTLEEIEIETVVVTGKSSSYKDDDDDYSFWFVFSSKEVIIQYYE